MDADLARVLAWAEEQGIELDPKAPIGAALVAALDELIDTVAERSLLPYGEVMEALERGGLVVAPISFDPNHPEQDEWGWSWKPTGCSARGYMSEAAAIEGAMQHLAQHDKTRAATHPAGRRRRLTVTV